MAKYEANKKWSFDGEVFHSGIIGDIGFSIWLRFDNFCKFFCQIKLLSVSFLLPGSLFAVYVQLVETRWIPATGSRH